MNLTDSNRHRLAPNIKKVVLIGQSIGCNAVVQLLNERSELDPLLAHLLPYMPTPVLFSSIDMHEEGRSSCPRLRHARPATARAQQREPPSSGLVQEALTCHLPRGAPGHCRRRKSGQALREGCVRTRIARRFKVHAHASVLAVIISNDPRPTHALSSQFDELKLFIVDKLKEQYIALPDVQMTNEEDESR